MTESLTVRGQLLLRMGELMGTVDQIAERMDDHDVRVTKLLENHEGRIKSGETFRARIKGAGGALAALGGASLAWWRANGF